jgi:hypothetical protein
MVLDTSEEKMKDYAPVEINFRNCVELKQTSLTGGMSKSSWTDKIHKSANECNTTPHDYRSKDSSIKFYGESKKFSPLRQEEIDQLQKVNEDSYRIRQARHRNQVVKDY